MATITRFEDFEVWQLARQQLNDFNILVKETSLRSNYELRNQMDSSSGSVMDCIAEGFDKSGNAEFRNFSLIAKGSNGGFRSQLYRCLDRLHIVKEEFDKLCTKNMIREAN